MVMVIASQDCVSGLRLRIASPDLSHLGVSVFKAALLGSPSRLVSRANTAALDDTVRVKVPWFQEASVEVSINSEIVPVW